MCHYAMRTWDRAHHGSIMLYGHSHGTLPAYSRNGNFYKTMDVGIDTHFEFRPYHIDEIRDIMSNRNTLNIDDYDKNTN